MKTRFFFVICVALIVFGSITAWAVAPDKALLSGITTTPTSSIVLGQGNSRNAVLTTDVGPGASISLTFTVQVDSPTGNTSTSYPDTLYLTSETILKPTGASDVSVPGLSDCTLSTRTGTCSKSLTFYAPITAGAYQVKFLANDGRSGQSAAGKMDQDFFILNFTVLANTCNPTPTTLTLTLQPACAIYHAPSDVFTATLTPSLSGQTIGFAVEGTPVGTAQTTNGVASFTWDPSALRVGDYTVSAGYQGDGCNYDASSATATLGIQYNFIGFQQPINADGTSIFGGKSLPVKIKITDYYLAPVPDATATVFYEGISSGTVGTTLENATTGLNFDYGNLMRYDSSADQYVYNWDLSNVPTGTGTVRVFLGEGSCAPAHQVVLSIGKKNGK